MTSADTRTESRPDVDIRNRPEQRVGEHRQDETKPSFMTTEFWLTIAGIVALIVVYNKADNPSLDMFRTCLLSTMAGIAYVVSRGLAKAGAGRRIDHDRNRR